MSVPLQSNLLLSLAGDVREAVLRFKRSSLESFEAYLTAGGKLVEARGEAKRGQWGPFLEAAGVDGRTARDMMTIARAGLTAGQVYRHGGVRGALEALREAAGDALDPGDVGHEKTATVAVFSGDEHPVGAYERYVQARGEGRTDPARPEPPAASVRPFGASPGDIEPDPPMTLRQRRRAGGLCADCGAQSGEAYRCWVCRQARARSNATAASRRRIGRALEGQIREAAAKGQGVHLTADEVRSLVQPSKRQGGGKT